MRVECYFNLRTHLWSVRALEGPDAGRVIGHAEKVLIRYARFVVQPAGRERVRREGVKNVHAFVRGELHGARWMDVGKPMEWTSGDTAYARAAMRLGVKVRYKPCFDETFVSLSPIDGRLRGPIHEAPMVFLGGGRAVVAFDPLYMTEAESAAATV
jgi:hypothetical protein